MCKYFETGDQSQGSMSGQKFKIILAVLGREVDRAEDKRQKAGRLLYGQVTGLEVLLYHGAFTGVQLCTTLSIFT